MRYRDLKFSLLTPNPETLLGMSYLYVTYRIDTYFKEGNYSLLTSLAGGISYKPFLADLYSD